MRRLDFTASVFFRINRRIIVLFPRIYPSSVQQRLAGGVVS